MPVQRLTSRRWEKQPSETEIELYDCPCCKGEAMLATKGPSLKMVVVCTKCLLTTPPCDSAVIAVGIWNTRPKEENQNAG